MAAAIDNSTNADKVATAGQVKNAIDSAVNNIDVAVSATAADGNQYSVLTGFEIEDGVLKSNSVTEVKLAAIAKTGNVSDLIQSSGDVLVFNCGNAT